MPKYTFTTPDKKTMTVVGNTPPNKEQMAKLYEKAQLSKQPQPTQNPEQQAQLDKYKQDDKKLLGKTVGFAGKMMGLDVQNREEAAKELLSKGKDIGYWDVEKQRIGKTLAPKSLTKGAVNAAALQFNPLGKLTAATKLGKAGLGLAKAGTAGLGYGTATGISEKLDGKSNKEALDAAKKSVLFGGGLHLGGQAIGGAVKGIDQFIFDHSLKNISPEVKAYIKANPLVTAKPKAKASETGEKLISSFTGLKKDLGKKVGALEEKAFQKGGKVDLRPVADEVIANAKEYKTYGVEGATKKLPTKGSLYEAFRKDIFSKGNIPKKKPLSLQDMSNLVEKQDRELNSLFNKQVGGKATALDRAALGVRRSSEKALKEGYSKALGKKGKEYLDTHSALAEVNKLFGENKGALKTLTPDNVIAKMKFAMKENNPETFNRLIKINEMLPPDKKVADNVIQQIIGDEMSFLKGYDIHHTSDIFGIPYRIGKWTGQAGVRRRFRTALKEKATDEGTNKLAKALLGAKRAGKRSLPYGASKAGQE